MPKFGKRSRRARWKDRQELKRWTNHVVGLMGYDGVISPMYVKGQLQQVQDTTDFLATVKRVSATHTPRTGVALEDYLEEQRKLVVKPKPVAPVVVKPPARRRPTKKERITS